MKKKLPQFNNEDEEREFWDTHDTTEYFDESDIVHMDLSHLKPSSRSVTIRLSDSLLYNLKLLANKKDVPYQSLIKVYLDEKVQTELGGSYTVKNTEAMVLRDKGRKKK